jgi:hypothetical protein
MELRFTTAPPPDFRNQGRAAFIVRKSPRKLMSTPSCVSAEEEKRETVRAELFGDGIAEAAGGARDDRRVLV